MQHMSTWALIWWASRRTSSGVIIPQVLDRRQHKDSQHFSPTPLYQETEQNLVSFRGFWGSGQSSGTPPILYAVAVNQSWAGSSSYRLLLNLHCEAISDSSRQIWLILPVSFSRILLRDIFHCVAYLPIWVLIRLNSSGAENGFSSSSTPTASDTEEELGEFINIPLILIDHLTFKLFMWIDSVLKNSPVKQAWLYPWWFIFCVTLIGHQCPEICLNIILMFLWGCFGWGYILIGELWVKKITLYKVEELNEYNQLKVWVEHKT